VDLGADSKGQREIEFQTTVTSSVGVQFFAWCWAYQAGSSFKADVLFDKTGVQRHEFAPGEHNIAIKVVDNDGLESLEVLRLKVNGVVVTG